MTHKFNFGKFYIDDLGKFTFYDLKDAVCLQ